MTLIAVEGLDNDFSQVFSIKNQLPQGARRRINVNDVPSATSYAQYNVILNNEFSNNKHLR